MAVVFFFFFVVFTFTDKKTIAPLPPQGFYYANHSYQNEMTDKLKFEIKK